MSLHRRDAAFGKEPHADIAICPPTRQTRSNSSRPALKSGKWDTTNPAVTALKVASRNGRRGTSAEATAYLDVFRDHRIISSDASTPITHPPGPTAAAAGVATAPVPVPTSSTIAPLDRFKISTR